jgi:hypothetical protein
MHYCPCPSQKPSAMIGFEGRGARKYPSKADSNQILISFLEVLNESDLVLPTDTKRFKAMKNILVPSDFSESSLACVDTLLHRFKHERLNVLLFHGVWLPDSITELLLLAERKEEEDMSETFRNCCQHLVEEHQPQLHTIRARYFYGSTVAVFKNFLDAHDIDLIAYPRNYRFRQLFKHSLNPSHLIDKCGMDVLILPSERQQEAEGYALHDLSLAQRP